MNSFLFEPQSWPSSLFLSQNEYHLHFDFICHDFLFLFSVCNDIFQFNPFLSHTVLLSPFGVRRCQSNSVLMMCAVCQISSQPCVDICRSECSRLVQSAEFIVDVVCMSVNLSACFLQDSSLVSFRAGCYSVTFPHALVSVALCFSWHVRCVRFSVRGQVSKQEVTLQSFYMSWMKVVLRVWRQACCKPLQILSLTCFCAGGFTVTFRHD